MNRVVHIHGGSVLLDRIADSGIEGDSLEWCDVFLFGPTPAGVSAAEWYDIRARALEELGGPLEGVSYRDRLMGQDRALAAVCDDPEAEIVLWFGPELFCQTILIALLSRLAGRPRMSLISPGDMPGKPRGCSVSYLSPEELQAAFAVRAPVSAEQTALAQRAWAAWCSVDQRAALGTLVGEDLAALPHLREAVLRWLDEPARTDRLIRDALAAGQRDWREVFRTVQSAEPRPWLTDQLFLYRLQQLSG